MKFRIIPFSHLSVGYFYLVALTFIHPTLAFKTFAQPTTETYKLENPITAEYIRAHLRKSSPRLVLNSETEQRLKKKLETDPVVRNMYEAIKRNAAQILKQPLLERIVTGRRLLGVSREMLYRANILGMMYRLEKDPVILNRLNEELIAVCNFSDWNPSHFLDVAEMSLAVSIGVDWTAGDLPGSTIELAKSALIDKGLMPGFEENGNTWWVKSNNNWNQVCHAGMIAAAIVIAEDNPELSAKTIHRALDNMHYALEEYGPDGVYPEGSTYWEYGTSFTVITAAIFESAFGTDFRLTHFPGLMESATFRVLCNAPSGMYYNFADCGDKRSDQGDMTLAWFAVKTGNRAFFEEERFLRPPEKMGKLSRLAGAGLVWMSQFGEKVEQNVPTAWKGAGPNPIVIFTGGMDDSHQYYFGAKGGRGSVNHGNMDAGSFVFELHGVRWVIDPGNQSYHELEQAGFDLWNSCQECDRWTLLTKNNFGHSTLTVNNRLHEVDSLAVISEFKHGDHSEATINMTPVFGGLVKDAKRRFVKDGPASLLIEDNIVVTGETEMVTWQLITQADVETTPGGAILRQDGKTLHVEIISPPEIKFSVISLDPPPIKLDRRIGNLKRLELRVPGYMHEDGDITIAVRLWGE